MTKIVQSIIKHAQSLGCEVNTDYYVKGWFDIYAPEGTVFTASGCSTLMVDRDAAGGSWKRACDSARLDLDDGFERRI